MSNSRELRARLLLAITACCAPACRPATTDMGSSEPQTVDVTPPTTAAATTTAIATAVPTATPTARATGPGDTPKSSGKWLRTDLGDGFWSVEEARAEPVLPRPSMPSCPHATYCVHAPATTPSAAAPAPYQTCAAEAAPPKQPQGQITFNDGLTRSEREVDKTACCYGWYIPCPGGRPLVDERGAAVVASVVSSSTWLASTERGTPVPSDEAREALAAHWAREALFEHASVASFSIASLELLGLGAPAELVADVHRAALDEIDHARRCFSLASRFSGSALGPSALPAPAPPSVDARDIARKTLRDACLNETVASLVAAHARDRSVGEARAVLAVIAEDEARHAELGFRTLAWLTSSFDVADALAAELDALSLEGDVLLDDAAEPSEELRAHGVVGAREQGTIRRAAVADVVRPCLEALLGARGASLASARATRHA
jgi:hypothetical protein